MPAPIEPQTFAHGPNVVDIGDLRVARGLTRRPISTCRHLSLVYDATERRVWCRDCDSEIEAFDAFTTLVKWHSATEDRIQRFRDAEKHTLISRAAKRLDDVWRSKNYVPQCPHCRAAILPEDVAGGVATTSKELVLRRRGKSKGDAGPAS